MVKFWEQVPISPGITSDTIPESDVCVIVTQWDPGCLVLSVCHDSDPGPCSALGGRGAGLEPAVPHMVPHGVPHALPQAAACPQLQAASVLFISADWQ